MGRIKPTRLSIFTICFIFVFSNFVLSCDNIDVYSSVRNEIAQSRNVVASGFFPSEACIDVKSSIKIVFEKSIAPDSVKFSGSLATGIGKIEWSTTKVENDTVTLTPLNKWEADTTISAETASLYIKGNDVEGWPCCNIEWKPEILDKIIYVNELHGEDNDKGSGSSIKPFKTLIYALDQVSKLYTNTTQTELRLAQGVYCSQDENTEYMYCIIAPIIIKGGYSNTDWKVRDVTKYESIILGYCNKNPPATIIFSECDGAVLDGLTIQRLTYNENHDNSYCGVLVDRSKIKLLDCKVEINGEFNNKTSAVVVDNNSSLTMENSTIRAVYNENNSVAILSKGSLSLSNCTIDVIDFYIKESHLLDGIIAYSNTDIRNTRISISSSQNSIPWGISLVDNNNKNSVINLTSNTITVTSSDKLSNAFGIYIDNPTSDKVIIDSNKINLTCSTANATSIFVSNTPNVSIQNNILSIPYCNNAIGVWLKSSTNISIKNNSIFLDNIDTENMREVYNKGALLSDSSSASFIGNMFIGCNYIAMSKRSTGILCNSSVDIITQLENNAFININTYLVIKDFYRNKYYLPTTAGLSSLNSNYKDSFGKPSDNLYYPTIEETYIYWTSADPLRPSINTPQAIKQSTLEVAPDFDILGNTRTIPYSIGAYEVD